MTHNLLSEEHLTQMNILRDNLMKGTGIEPGSLDSLLFYALATSGEGSELLEQAMFVSISLGKLNNLAKKIMRDGDHAQLRANIQNEIADCIIYLQHMCDDQGWSPSVIVAQKLYELRQRWPEHFVGGSDG